MPAVVASDFEAAFLGGAAWRYVYGDDPQPASISAAARAEGVKLVTCRVAAEDDGAVSTLEAAGFRRIEELVTFQRRIKPTPECLRDVVSAAAGDRDACIEIALEALRRDRYHADPLIDDEVADRIKAAWVSNNLAGRADLCLVARDPSGTVVGFNQLLRPGRSAVIDLIAVSPATQQQGYGGALVAAGLRAYAASADVMLVGTQATNRASISLYRSMGFELLHRQATYHLVPG